MEGNRFDDLVRRVAAYSSRRGIVRAVAAAAAVPALAGLGLKPADEAAAKKKKKKITLCLDGQTIQASKKKKKKALKQGATVGACVPPPPPPPPPGTTTTTTTTPAPQCLGLLESCETGTCCGDLVCGDNFCDDPPLCCAEFGGDCSEHCDCCGLCAFCTVEGTCDCDGAVCNGECTCGDCCDSDDCPGTQICSPDGFCTCTSGFACGEQCCDTGDEVCNEIPGPVACQDGPCPTYDYCSVPDLYTCGEGCDCVTSIGGINTCTDFAEFSCDVDCTTDGECVTLLGAGAICVKTGDLCEGACEDLEQNFCISGGCAPLRAAQGNAGAFRGKGATGNAPRSAKTTAARGKADQGGRKRRQKKGRR